MAREVDDDGHAGDDAIVHGSPARVPAPAPAQGGSNGALEPRAAPAPRHPHRSSVMLDLLQAASDGAALAGHSTDVDLHPLGPSAPAPSGRGVASRYASDLAPPPGSSSTAAQGTPDAGRTTASVFLDPVARRDRLRASTITIETAQGRELAVHVGSDTRTPVNLIKEEIRQLIGVPVGLKRLYFEEEEELKDGLVVPGSRLFLSILLVVDAPTLGYSIAMDTVRAFDTVARVKEHLELASEGALPAATTVLRFRGVDMDDGKTLLDYDGLLASGVLVTAVPASSAADDGDWLEFADMDEPAAAASEQRTVEVDAVPQPAAAAQQRVAYTVRETSDAERNSDVARFLRAARANLAGSEVDDSEPRDTTVRDASYAELNNDVAKFLHAARVNLIGSNVAADQPRATTVRDASDEELQSEVAQSLRAARANLMGSDVAANQLPVTTVRKASATELQSEVAQSLRAAAAAQGLWGMRVTVAMPDALGGRSVVVELSAHDTVQDLRTMVAQLEPPEPYYFSLRGEQRMDEHSYIAWHMIRDGDVIYIIPDIVADGT